MEQVDQETAKEVSGIQETPERYRNEASSDSHQYGARDLPPSTLVGADKVSDLAQNRFRGDPVYVVLWGSSRYFSGSLIHHKGVGGNDPHSTPFRDARQERS